MRGGEAESESSLGLGLVSLHVLRPDAAGSTGQVRLRLLLPSEVETVILQKGKGAMYVSLSQSSLLLLTWKRGHVESCRNVKAKAIVLIDTRPCKGVHTQIKLCLLHFRAVHFQF